MKVKTPLPPCHIAICLIFVILIEYKLTGFQADSSDLQVNGVKVNSILMNM